MNNLLENIQLQKKTIFMRVYIITIVLIIALISIIPICIITLRSDNQYSAILQKYKAKHLPQHQDYLHFDFYQKNDELLYQNKELNQQYRDEVKNFSKDINQNQFRQIYSIVTKVARQTKFTQIGEFEFKSTYDWSRYLAPIKNNRHFQSGHIFSIVAAVQFYFHIKNKSNSTLITLSQQQIIDCCSGSRCFKDWNYHPERDVYQYLMKYGLQTDTVYPYVNSIVNREKKECKNPKGNKDFKIRGYYEEEKNCNNLYDLITKGPVVVGVDARNWKQYQYGIFTDCQQKITHYGLLVGRGIGFWKIRNSWGIKWGQSGHIRLKTGNTCGICLRASKPIL